MSLEQLLKHEEGTPFGRTLRRFVDGDQFERDSKFKAVAAMINAPWALRQVIPKRPVILGRKVALRYFRSADHFEIDLDVSSSPLCDRIYRTLKWCSKHSVEEIAFMVRV